MGDAFDVWVRVGVRAWLDTERLRVLETFGVLLILASSDGVFVTSAVLDSASVCVSEIDGLDDSEGLLEMEGSIVS